jgi:FkbM family methyltransferase
VSAKVLALLGNAARRAQRAGLGRLVNALVDALDLVLLRVRVTPLAATSEGMVLRGYLRHRSFLAYVETGIGDERFYRDLILRNVKRETTFVDGGAHLGLYTLLASESARRVVAFEPDPYNAAALRTNVASAGCENVEIYADALAERCGSATFRAFRSTISGSLVAREVGDYAELTVQVRTLDDILDESDLENLVIKLDLEGAEPLALIGMRETIARAHDLTIFVEVNPAALQAGGWTADRLLADLLAAQLCCALVDEKRRTLVPLMEAQDLPKTNLVCWKSRVTQGRVFHGLTPR